ncbi:deacetylase EF_0837-like isoform X2 [Mercenaria mercenaria]|uniref:deacetylase EF_0837-like isoform X2 n=1 Tax=Mercenaria mercenaria TaxID=6596 RepID=UPI00234E9257|nr:deacetylase EF_0837-like isoform X2 [Mercenaria mercenaria]
MLGVQVLQHFLVFESLSLTSQRHVFVVCYTSPSTDWQRPAVLAEHLVENQTRWRSWMRRNVLSVFKPTVMLLSVSRSDYQRACVTMVVWKLKHSGAQMYHFSCRRALSAAKRCAVPLMVHHVESTIPTQTDRASPSSLGCPKDLQAGDIYTHTYNGWRCSIVDPETKEIHSDVIEAKARGVLFDSGHGAGAFNWTVAEIAAKQNFWPNLMGSDLHTENQEGPAYDIPTVMTKFLHLGMPLNEIVRSVTSSPARAYSLNSIGSLSEGMDADVSVLRIDECDVNLEDTVGQKRNVKKRILPVAVWRDGKEHQVVLPTIWPNTNAIKRGLMINKHQIVKDKE